jgi:ABC-2 type transport system ATP-binding protein
LRFAQGALPRVHAPIVAGFLLPARRIYYPEAIFVYTMPMDDILSLRGVGVSLGGTSLLADISLSLKPGELVGLLGPSGAGKTTLMRSIMGLQAVSAGECRVLGGLPGDVRVRGQIGYVTQAPSVYADLTVKENLRYFAGVLSVGRDEVPRVLKAVKLEAQAGQMVATLSGGQRSRTSLAAALLGSPKLLVLDEPTVGLDPLLREELWQLFRELGNTGSALLISSHVMDEAERCDRLLLLREGRQLAEGTPAELKQRTGTDSVEGAFLGLVTAGS